MNELIKSWFWKFMVFPGFKNISYMKFSVNSINTNMYFHEFSFQMIQLGFMFENFTPLTDYQQVFIDLVSCSSFVSYFSMFLFYVNVHFSHYMTSLQRKLLHFRQL